jgi:hypothetical protein
VTKDTFKDISKDEGKKIIFWIFGPGNLTAK